jgi:hypothetical protein
MVWLTKFNDSSFAVIILLITKKNIYEKIIINPWINDIICL